MSIPGYGDLSQKSVDCRALMLFGVRQVVERFPWRFLCILTGDVISQVYQRLAGGISR